MHFSFIIIIFILDATVPRLSNTVFSSIHQVMVHGIQKTTLFNFDRSTRSVKYPLLPPPYTFRPRAPSRWKPQAVKSEIITKYHTPASSPGFLDNITEMGLKQNNGIQSPSSMCLHIYRLKKRRTPRCGNHRVRYDII